MIIAVLSLAAIMVGVRSMLSPEVPDGAAPTLRQAGVDLPSTWKQVASTPTGSAWSAPDASATVSIGSTPVIGGQADAIANAKQAITREFTVRGGITVTPIEFDNGHRGSVVRYRTGNPSNVWVAQAWQRDDVANVDIIATAASSDHAWATTDGMAMLRSLSHTREGG